MGLEKLVSSENAVGVMQVELQELKPKLIESGKEVAALMEVIDKETIEANKVRGLLDFYLTRKAVPIGERWS
jgi:dynein heavy chain